MKFLVLMTSASTENLFNIILATQQSEMTHQLRVWLAKFEQSSPYPIPSLQDFAIIVEHQGIL